MSILSFPRVNFRGVFTCNPVTSNNDDVMAAVVERDLDSLGIMLAGMTDDQAKAYLQETAVMAISPDAPCKPYIRSGWNYYGDYATTFDSTVVTSVVSGPKAADRVTSSATDWLVGQSVALLGSVPARSERRRYAMMCDLDATGLVTTQVYLGGLYIGPPCEIGEAPPAASLLLNHNTRCFQNWLNFFSTVGAYAGEQNFVGIGCVWQFTIPSAAIPLEVDIESPRLRALLTAARGAAGLAVRFRCFEVEPGLTSTTLAAAHKEGQGDPNPASGYLIGTIGVWEKGEPETETAGRKLTCPYPRPGMTYAGAPPPPPFIPPAPAPWTAHLPPALVGNAVAQVQPSLGVVSLDLIASFPKNGFRNPSGPEDHPGGFDAPRQKADLGPIQLAVVPPGGAVDGATGQPIANIDYGVADYSAYEDFGGIVDVPYDPSLSTALASGLLVIQSTPDNAVNPATTLLRETPIRVVTDDRALYLVPGRTPHPVRLKIYDRGGATKADTTLHLFEYCNVIVPQFGACDAAGQEGVRPNQTVALDTRGLLRFPPQVTIPAGQGFSDWFTLPVEVAWSGAAILSYQVDPTVFGQGNPLGVTGAAPVTGVPVWSYATYSAVRIFASEDFSALYAKGPLEWSDVYNAALRYYSLLFPAMSAFIQLNDEASIVSHADVLRRRLNTPDKPEFFTTFNMPPTRSMSPAKVKLILDFLDQQTRRAHPGTT
jgi:hypothetical protein